jgi:hypothetical protein
MPTTCGGVKTKFIVLEGRMYSPPLLSRETLTRLGMMMIKEDGSFATGNDL